MFDFSFKNRNTLLLMLVITVCHIATYGSTTAAKVADPLVNLELIMEAGFPIGGQQDWLKSLSKVGADHLTIRQARPNDEILIEDIGTPGRAIYRVVGFLTSDGRLVVEGGTFRKGETAKMTLWLQKLKDDGIKLLTAPRIAFGLSADHLVAMHNDLAKDIAFSTKDKTPKDVVRGLARMLKTKIEIAPDIRNEFEGQWKVPEEMQGVSAGTVLTATIRPLGLVAVPHRPQGGVTTLRICDFKSAKEFWPIGWPIEGAPAKAAPQLFEKHDIEIADYPLDATLDAIEKSAKTSFLYDHNSMARHGAKLDNKVSIAPAKLYYYRVIDRLLKQSDPAMKFELRADDGGKPFIWITTRKR